VSPGCGAASQMATPNSLWGKAHEDYQMLRLIKNALPHLLEGY
jgi:hypothetical protein